MAVRLAPDLQQFPSKKQKRNMTWQPGASIDILQARALMLRQIREFFDARDVMEVETPLIASAGVTDPHLVNFETRYQLPGASIDTNSENARAHLFLQTSPEFAMKRLLCAGSGSIYQICKAFRNEEQGRYHNPEFTILEWYKVEFDHWQLMDEMEELVSGLLATGAFERLSYQQAFQQYLSFDAIEATDEALFSLCEQEGFSDFVYSENDPQSKRDTLLQLLFSHKIEPKIGQDTPCFIYHFPASQAALAKLSPDNSKVAERFELYFKGIELANGFHELQAPQEQAKRFESDNQIRTELGINPAKTDDKFLAALEHGLPACAGVAMGLDRLLMLITHSDDIDQVLSFAINRT